MQRQLPAHFRSIIISADLFPLGSDRLSVSLLSWPHLHVNGSHFILFVTARPCAAVVETFWLAWVVASPSLYFSFDFPSAPCPFPRRQPSAAAQRKLLPRQFRPKMISCPPKQKTESSLRCIIDTSHQKWPSLFSAG
jgi:hypothetical protein